MASAHEQWMAAANAVDALPKDDLRGELRFELNMASQLIEEGEPRHACEVIRLVFERAREAS